MDQVSNTLRLRSELVFLAELCRVVASNTELQPILDWIAAKTTTMFEADEGTIKLLGPEPDKPDVKTIVSRQSSGLSSGSWPRIVSTNVMGFLMVHGETLATPDLASDPRFAGLRGGTEHVRSVLAVPLKVDNRFTGMLAVTQSSPGREWTDEEAQLLAIVASNSAGVIEQARLRVEATNLDRIQKRLEKELTFAREIQLGLLPAGALRCGPWELVGRVVPARFVGGDAYDYFALEDGRVGIAIADVAGKGVPAALLMSNFQAQLRAVCEASNSVPDVVRMVNRGIARTVAPGTFITLFYGELDPRRGTLHYTNAGHNFPLLRRSDGTIVKLEEGGLPLGVRDHATYDHAEIAMGRDDALLLFSDGITEALDAAQEQFGDARLEDAWKKLGDVPPGRVIDRLLAEVAGFRGRADQSDDMTLLVVGAGEGAGGGADRAAS